MNKEQFGILRVSQLIQAIPKDDEIVIEDLNLSADRTVVFSGTVGEIKKDDPVNKMYVVSLSTLDDVIYVLTQGGADYEQRAD